ncbi:coiled-coil domain-containing protein 13 isoform X1 [Amblyraja radiata]|uniref:coiled-coil domain-containing protein 13 isoform X1 n=1 Tax=Amblyraja radiata TaxID=386614 RepID=UPI001403D5DC|nr:coiled-coil domain-containing protein 13 isoform X1 [Amblyraja radiata]
MIRRPAAQGTSLTPGPSPGVSLRMEGDVDADEEVTRGLRQQFQALQEQQQRRLEKMLAAKKEQAASQAAPDRQDHDDLKLHLVAPQPASIHVATSLLENENEQLQEQILELRNENGRLYKLLSERDYEIKYLKKKREEERLALAETVGMTSDVAASKMVELSKRNRELTVENESHKSKVKQLSNKLQELEKELQTYLTGNQTLSVNEASGQTNKKSSPKIQNESLFDSIDVKTLQDKLSAVNLKLVESRNQMLSVKQELKVAHKILTNEVGDEVNIQHLLNNKGSWRGRAQQILTLQKKIRDLESQFGSNTHKEQSSERSVEEEMLGSSGIRRLSNQEKNVAHIRAMERERKETFERMTGDYEKLKKDHEDLKSKFDGSKARIQVLSMELKTLKSQVVTLLQKGKHDDELVDALLKQQKQMQELLAHANEQGSKSKENTSQHLNVEAQKQDFLIGELKQLVTEREAKVNDLEKEIRQLLLKQQQEKKVLADQSVVNPTHSHPSSAQLDTDSDLPVPDSLTADGELSGRPISACSVSKMGHILIESAAMRSRSGTPIGRTNSVSQIDVKPLQLQCTEYKALYHTAEVEKDKLTELVTILQKRLKDNNDKILDVEQKFQEQRRWSVTLEQQLGKAKLDMGKSHDVNKLTNKNKTSLSINTSLLCGSGDLSPGKSSALSLETQLEELNIRLAIQMDENKALKMGLQSSLQAKEEDLKLYHDMLSQVKQVFLQALRQHKENN